MADNRLEKLKQLLGTDQDPDLQNIQPTTNPNMQKAFGGIVAPEVVEAQEKQRIRQGLGTPTNPEQFTADPGMDERYAKAMQMIKQKQLEKMATGQGSLPSQQDMSDQDAAKLSAEFAGQAQPQPVVETPEQKMRRAMFGSK